MANAALMPFEFEGKTYTNIVNLADAMGMAWKSGKQALFSAKVGSYFKRIDKNLYNACQSAENDYREKPSEGDVIFLKWLCKIKGIKNLYWRGRNFGGVQQILELLQKGYDSEFLLLLSFMMKEQMFSIFLKNTGLADRLVHNIHYLEECYVKKDSKFNRKNINQLMYYVLSDTKTFDFDGNTFCKEKDLSVYLQKFANMSRSTLDSKVNVLYTDSYNLTPAFEGWLINLGHQKELSLWREKYQAGMPDTDEEEFSFMDEAEEQEQARNQNNEEFSKDVYGFENDFIKMLENYPDAISTPKKFEALIKDLFPEHTLQTYLIMTLYKMDIANCIQNAIELNDIFISRFVKRMNKDFGVKEQFARWAASVWCVCYGEKILQKKNRVTIYKVL